ncbi:MAG: hypothetical protein AABY26_02935 [Nanoarchaeota archaeon]
MNLSRFEQAEKFFGELERKASSATELVPVPSRGVDRHFNTAAYAAAVLYSLTNEKRRDLEDRNVISSSTYTGSLMSAMSNINHYLVRGRREFERDNYQQLRRTCYFAKVFLGSCKGTYHPAL